MNHEPFTSIENPTLAHFRHSVPRSFPTDCAILKGVRIITYFQTHSILTNKANFKKAQMNVNICYIKAYQILSRLPDIKTNPKQTQFLQRPKSLAGQSGHTRRSPMGAIILTFVSDMHILKWFFGMEKYNEIYKNARAGQ